MYYPVKALAALSLVAVAIKYWMPTEIGFAFVLLPYLVLYFLANANNYRNKRLFLIRIIAALFTIILAPVLIFGMSTKWVDINEAIAHNERTIANSDKQGLSILRETFLLKRIACELQ